LALKTAAYHLVENDCKGNIERKGHVADGGKGTGGLTRRWGLKKKEGLVIVARWTRALPALLLCLWKGRKKPISYAVQEERSDGETEC